MIQTIYVVEGPAGSGKSTLINDHVLETPFQLIEGLKDPARRSYAGRHGLNEITVRDIAKVADALTSNIQHVVFDRWVLGSFVYDYIRGDAKLPIEEEFQHVMVGWIAIINGLVNVLMARGRDYPDKINIAWKLYLPPPEVIHARRTSSAKKYPFGSAQEYDAYLYVFEQLKYFIKEYPGVGSIDMSYQDVYGEDWEW